MIVADLQDYLAGKDITLTLDGDNLRIDAPAGVLTDELRQAIRDNKPALVALLNSQACAAPPRPIKRCYTCGGKKWWRLRQGTVWVCERCHPPVRNDVVFIDVH